MPRNRTIKPEFFRSISLSKCVPNARLTFAGLWCWADDFGRYRYEPQILKADVWALDDTVTWQDIDLHVSELLHVGVLCEYEADGRRYLHVVNWREHQTVDHPSKKVMPPCPRDRHGGPMSESSRESREPSPSPRVALDEGSRLEARSYELKAREEQPIVEQARPGAADIEHVFETWKKATGKHKAQLDSRRRRKIADALKVYPHEDVLAAVQGWANSPHHRGENERGTVYNDLELLLRDAKHIETFRDFYHGDGLATASRRAPGTAAGADEFTSYDVTGRISL